MDGNIKLLEERVFRAVDRLRELSAERKELEGELRALRKQLEAVVPGGSAGPVAKDPKQEEVWRSRRAEAIGAIRETLAELRGA